MPNNRFNRTGPKMLKARDLRRNFTNAEMRVWQKLRNRQPGVDFRRQHPASDYILDFYAPGVLEAIAIKIAELRMPGVTPTRRWCADLPLSGGGQERRGPA